MPQTNSYFSYLCPLLTSYQLLNFLPLLPGSVTSPMRMTYGSYSHDPRLCWLSASQLVLPTGLHTGAPASLRCVVGLQPAHLSSRSAASRFSVLVRPLMSWAQLVRIAGCKKYASTGTEFSLSPSVCVLEKHSCSRRRHTVSQGNAGSSESMSLRHPRPCRQVPPSCQAACSASW